MGIWKTRNGKSYKVNMYQTSIEMMQRHGARFCWMRQNYQILDKNSDYYEDVKVAEKSSRSLKQGITVVCEDGENITGYVSHWVKGSTDASDEKDWFIIQPGTYPTYGSTMHVEEL